MELKLIHFLKNDLGISTVQIQLAVRQIPHHPEQLPMILWQYGLINLNQLEQIWDWLLTV